MIYKSTDHVSDINILLFCWFCVCCILKHLKYKKLWSVDIYWMGLTSFAFSNCTEELGFAPFFHTQFENSDDVTPVTFNKQTVHSTPIFATIQLLKIDDIRQLQLLTFVYDCLNKLAPTYFHHYFVNCSQVHSYCTRLASRGDLFLERKNTF